MAKYPAWSRRLVGLTVTLASAAFLAGAEAQTTGSLHPIFPQTAWRGTATPAYSEV